MTRALVCNGNGSITGATAFALSETGAGATALIRSATTVACANNATITSSTFTITAADVIDGVLLWLKNAVASPNVTLTVGIYKAAVLQTSCTVNLSDMPPSADSATSPVFFKFGATVTGDGVAGNWTLKATCGSGVGSLTLQCNSATTTDWTRALRTTATATPAATDDMYICGEWTAAATVTARTVTMDQTATTAYGSGVLNSTSAAGGGIHIGSQGTLNYGTAAATNYVLRINGDLNVWANGTLNIGSSGTPIPRNSTAVLEFVQNSLSGDFGLIANDNSALNAYGLSRTSGKNVVSCKLTTDFGVPPMALGSFTPSAVTQTLLAAPDATGIEVRGTTIVDTVATSPHFTYAQGTNNTATTVVCTVWLKGGSGTHNRFVRLIAGSVNTVPPTNGFFADIDLNLGTIGACTAVGNGTATSSSITPSGGGYICQIVGKVSSGVATNYMMIAACSAAGTTSYTGDATQNFIYSNAGIYVASSLPASANVDTDTGWLSGDEIAIASTSKTVTESEALNLASNATSSALSLAINPVYFHSGTSPTQAEVINLTRNVKIRSTSPTLTSYIYATALAVVNMQWTEVIHCGNNASPKYGIVVDATTSGTAGAKNISFCSIHGNGWHGLYNSLNGGNSINLNLSYFVVFLNGSGSGVLIFFPLTQTDWIIDHCVTMLWPSGLGGSGYSLGDVGGTFTNNTGVGSGNAAYIMNFNESGGATYGTFSGLTAHSNNLGPINVVTGAGGVLSNVTIWHSGSSGLILGNTAVATMIDFAVNNFTIFGTLNGIQFGGPTSNVSISNGALNGDATQAMTAAFSFTFGNDYEIAFDNVTTTASGSLVVPVKDFGFVTIGPPTNPPSPVQITTRNCAFGAPTLITSKVEWGAQSYLASEKFGQTSGDHRCEMTNGQLKTDLAIFNTAAPSMRMTPANALGKLQSATKGNGIQIAVNNGSSLTVTANARTSVVGDGAAYNGNPPRLIVRANPAIGINADTVLATLAVGAGAWGPLTGTTIAVNDNGALEFVVDCDGTAGWINVDDWSVA